MLPCTGRADTDVAIRSHARPHRCNGRGRRSSALGPRGRPAVRLTTNRSFVLGPFAFAKSSPLYLLCQSFRLFARAFASAASIPCTSRAEGLGYRKRTAICHSALSPERANRRRLRRSTDLLHSRYVIDDSFVGFNLNAEGCASGISDALSRSRAPVRAGERVGVFVPAIAVV